ncbi:hypothetical protein ACFQ1I_05300 [Kitasatospora arboriphila]
MMRRRAGNPAKRIGSLFLNPGGPGGSGYLWATTTRFEPRVTDSFDLIGFDPRGVARSNPSSASPPTRRRPPSSTARSAYRSPGTRSAAPSPPTRTTPTPAPATPANWSSTCPP